MSSYDRNFLKAMKIAPCDLPEKRAARPARDGDPEIGTRAVDFWYDDDNVILSRSDWEWVSRSNSLLDEKLRAALDRESEAREARRGREFWMFVIGAALAWWGAWMVCTGGGRG